MRRRDWLIALNAAECLQRAALCSLARSAEDWMNIPLTDLPLAALRLGVPTRAIIKARSLEGEVQHLADTEVDDAAQLGARLIVLGDDDYPAALLDHPLPPPVLYCLGSMPAGPRVAIVGSRRMSPYGHEACQRFAQHLAAAGVVVVSGFARGVDAIAHRAALSVADGKTVAVLGCGIDVAYPRGHRDLAQDIARQGAVLSEFPLRSQPLPWRFPIRNRIIAGLATSTLVVQAAERSGSLITAHQALELGRDVYAVPGSIFDPLADGPNRLIADGATPALRPEDILEGLPLGEQMVLFPTVKPAVGRGSRQSSDPTTGGSTCQATASQGAPPQRTARAIPQSSMASEPSRPSGPPKPPPSGLGGRALAQLDLGDPISAEELAQRLGADIDQVLATLLELELDGWLRRFPGPRYGR